jgi:aryl-alcohol dehydrogenase-like predicted oxidoreductase
MLDIDCPPGGPIDQSLDPEDPSARHDPDMIESRRLGRSGIQVSPLGLGTARLAGLGWREDVVPPEISPSIRDAVRQIQAAVDLGVTLFDTADNYGQGLSECILGEALQGCREGILVATKFGEYPTPGQEDPWALDGDIVTQKCEASLRRLGVECIDASLNRVPLLMGVLAGRWVPQTKLEDGDPRAKWFTDQGFLIVLDCARQLEPYLTSDGRMYVQGALGWIRARSPITIPLPCFRNLAQMQELVQTRQFGPLSSDAMQAIAGLVMTQGN